ncbi:MAG: hypothetical protein A3B10_04695 [Candidatus Doudnabacteria bacterium RIFCSPLOWO2_01_FULL_44_21]|uniref:Uncharacterized protein n=1 Tax=Candidatus Doudnabacteria bacterium RIFCSPLOWO2_01_FULL_44_21 TaxID=1817841 RepID=A0A1F5PXN7_9BACT|nr:MAG: hypothetical protein A3B10_04695 [Candidatus Doudnabacteria bacterium RIFCSPLOWO2_01_FULL_44_21]
MYADTALKKYHKYFAPFLTPSQTKRLFTRLERVSCNIAPINPATGNTQTSVRWKLDKANPNYASEKECREIFTALVEDLLGFLGVKKFKARGYLQTYSDKNIAKEDVSSFLNTSSRIGSLELPIDYKRPLREDGKHTKDNIYWFSPFTKIVNLRNWVGNENIVTKIQVKSYLTDRRQTGDYQTNREIRWETHPKSPQYASRGDCMLIEAKLLAQISIFVGAPDLPVDLIEVVEEVLGSKFVKDSFKCPISGKPIFFNEFYEKVASPVHGRSGFQVGHLNPLASTGRHIASNTSWITDLGNRVQGESSLEQITNDIFFMANFHKERQSLDWSEVESIAKKTQS